MLDSPRPLRDLVETSGWDAVNETCLRLFNFPVEMVTTGSEIVEIRDALNSAQT